jgi:hypothetical protein
MLSVYNIVFFVNTCPQTCQISLVRQAAARAQEEAKRAKEEAKRLKEEKKKADEDEKKRKKAEEEQKKIEKRSTLKVGGVARVGGDDRRLVVQVGGYKMLGW